jgi:hypothetical protein
VLARLGLAKVRKTPPRLAVGAVKPVADDKTLEASIAHRYELMARYAKEMKRAVAGELSRLQAQGGAMRKRRRLRRPRESWLPSSPMRGQNGKHQQPKTRRNDREEDAPGPPVRTADRDRCQAADLCSA